MTRPIHDNDGGSVSVYVGLLAVVFLALTGLVTDGGRVLAGRQAAAATAASAARAGAQAVDVAAAREQAATVTPGAAAAAARSYLARRGATGRVAATPTAVTVTVTDTIDLPVLAVVGVDSRTVTATRRAELLRGVMDAE